MDGQRKNRIRAADDLRARRGEVLGTVCTAANRSEVVCTFLALLELIRLKQLVCVQPEPFAEIEISRAQPASGRRTGRAANKLRIGRPCAAAEAEGFGTATLVNRKSQS